MRHFALILNTAACLAAMALGVAAEPTDPAATRTAFLRGHCFKCHAADAEDGGGGVRLDTLAPDIGADIATADTWQKVLKAVNSGEMPPEDEPRPEAAKLEAFLESLSLGLVDARRRLADAGGGTTLRRLNRREYVNTIRALMGIEPDASNLPNDAGAGGYDTAGTSLSISSDQFEAYLNTARQTLRHWRTLHASHPTTEEPRRFRREVEEQSWLGLRRALQANEQGYDRAAAVLADAGTRAASDYDYVDVDFAWFHRHLYTLAIRSTVDFLRMPRVAQGTYLTFRNEKREESIAIPKGWPPGRYRLRVRCGAMPDAARSRRFLDIGQPVNEFTSLACRELLGTVDEPQIIETEFTFTAGRSPDIVVHERRQQTKLHETDYFYRHWSAHGTGVPPAIWIDWLELEGPLPNDDTGDRSLADLYPNDSTGLADAALREALSAFAARAFRGRMPPDHFLDKLVAIYRLQADRGVGHADAVTEPLAVILSAPAFLYLVEPAGPDDDSRKLSDREIAVRLAYFLTSGPPDRDLLAAATAGRLADPDQIAAQADRLIAGASSEAFVTGFVHQWLDMDRLDFFQFDPMAYWDFDESTREAARQEVYQFFARVLRENMPVRELLVSNWTVANGLLGSYYGFDDVRGDQWRVVNLPQESHRGGLLGMAAILAMGSNGVRTSPVERGAWVLRKLVDQPPPPAPANVPQLSRLDGELVSTRERLQMHQESPQCVHCHKKIDPIGFGLENFDAAGRWRTEELHNVRGKGKKTMPIEPTGTFIDGRTFRSFAELRDIVASCDEAFARSLTANLLEYGLGRPLGIGDDPLVDQIVAATTAGGHRLRDIIHAIVRSEAFRSK